MMSSAFRQRGVEPRAAVRVVPPDPAQKTEIKSLRTTGRLDRHSMVAERPTQRARHARQPRQRENDHGVGSLESHVERAPIVPIGDPGITAEQLHLECRPLGSRSLHPTGFPIMSIQMHHRYRGAPTKFSCEGRLTRATGAHDHGREDRASLAFEWRLLPSSASDPNPSGGCAFPVGGRPFRRNLPGGVPLISVQIYSWFCWVSA